MAPRAPRISFNSSSLVRLLAALTAAEAADSKRSLAEGLGLWLGWADAIALSAVLNGNAASPSALAAGKPIPAGAAGQEFARVRAELVHAIRTDDVLADGRPGGDTDLDSAADFAPYRRCHVAHQRAMEARIGPLRASLRAALAGVSPGLNRLAALDAVMEQALAAHERSSLSSVPSLLEKRFRGLRRAHQETGAGQAQEGGQTRAQPAGGWLAVFCRDMQGVLLAELDIRLQPVEGLMEALDHEMRSRDSNE